MSEKSNQNDLVNPSCTRSGTAIGGRPAPTPPKQREDAIIYLDLGRRRRMRERTSVSTGWAEDRGGRRVQAAAAAASSSPDPDRWRPCAAVASAGAATDDNDSETIAARSPYQRPGAQRHRTRPWN